MSMTIGELTGFLKLDDSDFNRGVDRSQSKFGSMAKGLGVAAAAGVAAATAAMAGLAVAGLKEFGKFERGMNEVFTLLPGASQQAMDSMSSDVRDFSMEMGTATEDVVPALYQALSAGVPEGNVFDFLETANQAAIGGITDLETAVDGITSVTNAYGDQISGAAEASDLMFTAVRLGKTDFEQLSSSLSNVIPIAAANKVQFADVAAALATMTAQGVPTAQATTQIRGAIVELSDSASDVGKAFEQVAGESFREFIASGGDMAGVMGILQEAADANGVSIDQLFGSVEAGSAALALSGENLDGFRGNIDAMAESAGATEAAYETMDSGIDRALERIGVAWDEVKLIIGEQLAPVLQNLADWVIENMPAIQAKFQELMTKATEMGESLRVWWTETAKPAMDAFVAFVEENWPAVQAIWEDLSDAAESVGDIISTVMEAMSKDTEDAADSIGESGEDAETTLTDLIDAAELASGQFAGAMEVLASAVEGDMERGEQALFDFNEDLVWWVADAAVLFGTFSHNVKEKTAEAIAAVAVMPITMSLKVRQELGRFGRLGRDIINGVISGVKERAGALAAEAVSAVVSALYRAREAVGARSPAKAFIDLGHDMGDGLVVGLHDMMADVVREAEAIAKAAAVDIGPAAFGGVSLGAGSMAGIGAGTNAGPTYMLNVDNHATRSMDERALAQQLNELSLLHGGRR